MVAPTLESFLTTFNALPEPAKRQVAVEILKQSREWEYAPLTDDELDQITDMAFVELDREEELNEQSQSR